MCRAGLRAAQSVSRNSQKTFATKRDATCFFRSQCIHGSQCWGVHTAPEIQLFRQRERLAQAVDQRPTRDGFSGVVEVCRQALFNEARRWYDGRELAASEDEFYDAGLIPRRRAHRRLRRQQRAQYRKEQRQKRRRAGLIKRRWLDLLMKGDKRRQQQPQVTVSTQTQSQQQLGVSGTPLAEENRVLAGACHKLVNQMDEMERELVAARRQVEVITLQDAGAMDLAEEFSQLEDNSVWLKSKNGWLEGELDRAQQDLDECLEQQERELTEQHNAAMADESVAYEDLLMQMSDMEDQIRYFRGRCSGEMVEGAAGEYTEEDYLALEGEKNGLAFQVGILNQRLEETRAELGELKWPSATSMTASEEDGIAKAVAAEKEKEWILAEQCCAAADARVVEYYKYGEKEVSQVGHHKSYCEFARAERGEASFDMANMVGCTCGYYAEQEKIRKKKERKNKTKHHNE